MSCCDPMAKTTETAGCCAPARAEAGGSASHARRDEPALGAQTCPCGEDCPCGPGCDCC